MSTKTTSLIPFQVTSIPDRLTAVYCANKTLLTTTAGSGGASAAVTRVNRLQSASFGVDTTVDEVTEMGAQFRPGGLDELGQAKIQLSWNDVGIGNIASLTGTTVSATPGATTSIGLSQLQGATVDLFRMIADVTNTIIKTTYVQDAVISDWTIDVKDKGAATESLSLMGPVVEDFPGFVVPAVYVATSTDATNGYLNIASAIGTDELPMAVYQPGPTEAPSYWTDNGAVYFLKIEKIPGANLSNPPVRYYEYVNATFQKAASVSSTAYITPSAFIKEIAVGTQMQLEVPGSANVEVVTVTAVASQVNTNSGSSSVASAGSATITPASMLGIKTGVTLQVDAAGTPETIQVTATTSTTFTATFADTHSSGFSITSLAPSFCANVTKTHAAASAIYPKLATATGARGFATYFPTGNKLYTGDSITSGDAYRLVFHSYNTDSFPLTIPTNSPDTSDRPGISYRMIPIDINAGSAGRGITSASLKFSLKRDTVNGIGEKSIVYGVPSIPDVSISLEAKERGAGLLAQLLTGSSNLSAQGGSYLSDAQEFSYVTRRGLKTAIPVTVSLNDPYNAGATIATYSAPQFVVKSISEDSTNNSDNTVKIDGEDITGNLTVSYTAPQ